MQNGASAKLSGMKSTHDKIVNNFKSSVFYRGGKMVLYKSKGPLLHIVIFLTIIIFIVMPLKTTKGAAAMMDSEELLGYSQRETIVNRLSGELTVHWVEGIKSLRAYDNHESEELKFDLAAMAWRFALNSHDLNIRQQLVNYLLDAVINGTSFIQGQALKFLQDFSPPDFDKYAINRLNSMSLIDGYSSETIRLIGIAGLRSKSAELNEIAAVNWQEIEVNQLYASPHWAAALVLARFDDVESTKRVIKQVMSENNIVVRATKLFKDLAYTKQQLVYNALRTYLHSKERLPELRVNTPGRPEAIYAAAMFAQHISGSPVTSTDLEEKDIATIRRWADAQLSWKIRN